MYRSFTAASLLALALTFAPYAMAGEGHSCCSADKAKKQGTAEKCDPKNCPPEKCAKAASCDKHQAAAQKTEAQKVAPKPQA